MLLEKTGYWIRTWFTYSTLSLKYFYWLCLNPVRALLAIYSKLFVPASTKRLDCRNKLVSPCTRLSECHSFRFVASKSWRKNPQQLHWASLLVPFIQQYLFTLGFVSHFGNSHNISNFFIFLMLVKSESESCSVVSDSLRPYGLYSPWNSPGQNTGVGSLPLLQEIFPTQGSNPGVPHCRRILLPDEPQGKPKNTGVGSLSLL